MAFRHLRAPRSNFSIAERAASPLFGRFETLSDLAAGTVILSLLAVTLVLPHVGELAPLLPVWLLVPIVLAAIRFRSPGALVTAVLALALAGPLVLWHAGPFRGDGVLDWVVAFLAFVAIGQFVAVAVHLPRGARLAALESMRAERTLRRALTAGQFEVHYQPIVSIATPHDFITSAEALLRWRDGAPGRGAPPELLAVAERSGVMREVSEFVLNETCKHIARWSGLFDRPFVISVNISASELADDTLPARIAACVTRHHIDPCQLGLEITETAVMANICHSTNLLRRIHDLGVRLAIDDFGTGQSSLEYIRLLPVDTLKIDGSFIDGIPRDPVSLKLVSTVVDLAHAMGIQAVAERIETDAQLVALRNIGCDYAQGFRFSPALSPKIITDWLNSRQRRPPQRLGRAVAYPARPTPRSPSRHRRQDRTPHRETGTAGAAA